MNITFVILHYKVEKVTQKCLDYLLQQNYKNLNVIVVDNCSSNGSYESLLHRYNKEKRVYFISLEYNLGFAKANDLGYQIAKHKFDAECIVIINNDIMIEDQDFCNRIRTIYNSKKFDILGPDIVNTIGKHQNPLKYCVTNKKDLNKLLFKSKIKLFFVPILYNLRLKKMSDKYEQSDWSKKKEGTPLHGSCL